MLFSDFIIYLGRIAVSVGLFFPLTLYGSRLINVNWKQVRPFAIHVSAIGYGINKKPKYLNRHETS